MCALQVGITGGIGSGKSLVCKIFQCFGVPVYDADSRAKNVMISDELLIAQIKKEFGSESYLDDGNLNREYISRQTFGQPARLEKLNQLVHPRVARDYDTWQQEYAKNSYVIKEAALLYEAGSAKSLDKIIVVTAPLELRIKRVLQRDTQRTEEDVKKIIASQMPQEEKEKLAGFVIVNDEAHLVIPQVLKLHQLFNSLQA